VTAALVALAVPAAALGTQEDPEPAPTEDQDPAPPGGTSVTGAVGDAGVVVVAEVDGLIDRVLADHIERQIDVAELDGAVSLVLQLNSTGAVVSTERLTALTDRIETAAVPVRVWIGPSGAQALGDATELVAAALARCESDPGARPCAGIAPRDSRVEVTRALLAGEQPPDGVALGDRVRAERAVELGLLDSDAAIVGEFVVDLPGVQTEVVDRGDRQVQEPLTQVRFVQLPLIEQLMHTVASAPVAYLLFVIGLSLLVFELFTAGVGIAGMVGAASLVLGSYGLAELPTRPVGIGLLLLAAFGYAVDVQTGVPRVWSGIATASLVAGSLVLYDGLSLSWLTLLVGIAGMALAMIGGMPAMVRTRFSTPTIGREWMVGELGTALGDVSPDGVVSVREAPWRAHTNRATPIPAGEQVRVVAIDGLVLEVEPLEGAARDHRDRR
jgi:membrane-bound serine protease (ClpP class)